MKRSDLDRALIFAKSDISLDYSNLHLFNGFALKGFKQVVATVKDLAALIRWQALMFNGEVDNESLTEIWNHRHRFIIV